MRKTILAGFAMVLAATPSFAQDYDHEHKANGVSAATSAAQTPSNGGKQHAGAEGRP